MNHALRQQAAPVAPRAVATPGEARQLADSLMKVMNDLLAIIEQETALVRAGHIREAIALEPSKADISKRYITMISLLKISQAYLASTTPDLLQALRKHHDVFRAMLQVNLTVLATAHAVSEGIVRGVNAEMQRRNIPQTYTAAGRQAQPGRANMTPLVMSRSL
ncbi:hypothetical protein E0H22_18440 [Rhodopseudomonas boonkerdii]|uniref:hypothetical protein n=1 Tax=Rhodopseudomonas boonkerdii TaxID=475937 RepID=UPI001E2B4420|nr:hypothetical protein [Rhodopseudomonas boonkerdii]UGV27489.1 hypothetical protein E0H22_18440 [Rhodopseudomonas boonkerdii]